VKTDKRRLQKVEWTRMGEDREEGRSLDGGLKVQQRGAASADLRNPVLMTNKDSTLVPVLPVS
jgi:hypothetical protein